MHRLLALDQLHLDGLLGGLELVAQLLLILQLLRQPLPLIFEPVDLGPRLDAELAVFVADVFVQRVLLRQLPHQLFHAVFEL